MSKIKEFLNSIVKFISNKYSDFIKSIVKFISNKYSSFIKHHRFNRCLKCPNAQDYCRRCGIIISVTKDRFSDNNRVINIKKCPLKIKKRRK